MLDTYATSVVALTQAPSRLLLRNSFATSKNSHVDLILALLRALNLGLTSALKRKLCRPVSKPNITKWYSRLVIWNAGVRAKVEHPFRVIKHQFGFVKVRYRGLKKNTQQLFTLFALSNLWMVRGKLMQMQA